MNRRRKQEHLPEDRNRRRQPATASSKKPTSAKGAPDSARPSDPQAARRDVRATWAVCIFLLLAVAAVFGQTVQHEFLNHDDALYVTQNLHITQDSPAQGIVWAFTSGHASNWHPLAWLSHILDFQLYGLHAGGHHLTSVLLHAAAAIVLFLALRQMTGDLWPSAFVAAVFAIHPLRVESVAWVAERKDVLSGLLFMLTLWAYVGYVRHSSSWARYLTVIALFALGLMSKPMLVTLPFVLLLLDYWPLGRMTPTAGSENETVPFNAATAWRLLIEKTPFLLLAAASCVVTVLVQHSATARLETLPLSSRLANALVSCVAYLGQFLFPADLAIYYPHPGAGLPTWKVAAAFLVLAVIVLGVLARWRRNPYLFVGWFWYLGMLVPVIGLVQVGEQAMADRYTYLPQIGLCIAVAWGAASLAKSWSYHRLACPTAAALAITILLGCAWRQTTFWHDDTTLWTHALQCTSRNHVAHFNLGEALRNHGDIDKAMQEFQAALDIRPTPLTHNNFGIALASQGQTEQAKKHFQAALDINPDYVEAHCNLGAALAIQGQTDEAIQCFRDALKINPDLANVHHHLGVLLTMRGRNEEAVEHFNAALANKHDFAEAHSGMAVLLANQGRIEEAITHYHEALRIKPDDLSALKNLAWLRATYPQSAFRDSVEAIALAQNAVRLSNGRDPGMLDVLAAAYAEAGNFPEAVEAARAALDIANQQNQRTLAEAVESRLRLYEAGTPYRQPSPSPIEQRSPPGG